MHPLVAIGLIFLTAVLWCGGALVLLGTLDGAQRRTQRQTRRADRRTATSSRAQTAEQ